MTGKVYKRPESVLVLAYTRTGEVLLLRRREPADFWQSVTGSLEWGESPAEAARRELAEESGLSAGGLSAAGVTRRFPIVPPWRERYAPETDHNTEHWFLLELPAPVPVRLSPREHTEYAWLPAAEAAARVGSWTNREAIERFVPAHEPG